MAGLKAMTASSAACTVLLMLLLATGSGKILLDQPICMKQACFHFPKPDHRPFLQQKKQRQKQRARRRQARVASVNQQPRSHQQLLQRFQRRRKNAKSFTSFGMRRASTISFLTSSSLPFPLFFAILFLLPCFSKQPLSGLLPCAHEFRVMNQFSVVLAQITSNSQELRRNAGWGVKLTLRRGSSG